MALEDLTELTEVELLKQIIEDQRETIKGLMDAFQKALSLVNVQPHLQYIPYQQYPPQQPITIPYPNVPWITYTSTAGDTGIYTIPTAGDTGDFQSGFSVSGTQQGNQAGGQ
jgi:hypothetical protein